ncbi:hypothetical protein AC579_5523 [Pseudocercospora musae]|uniref:Uncharacterized protein n=1 Tax=Pseudocercospora musae TaxID=113226 RepID=A0A139IMT5_9PEZI|nr:hypothetical protein AC579_5523 [Pseudocercospora musae]
MSATPGDTVVCENPLYSTCENAGILASRLSSDVDALANVLEGGITTCGCLASKRRPVRHAVEVEEVATSRRSAKWLGVGVASCLPSGGRPVLVVVVVAASDENLVAQRVVSFGQIGDIQLAAMEELGFCNVLQLPPIACLEQLANIWRVSVSLTIALAAAFALVTSLVRALLSGFASRGVGA